MPETAPGDAVAEFVEVMRRLRTECAWKAGQTHESLVPYLREETEELVEAIASGDDEHLCEELGDVLLQVVFHAVIAEQAGTFTLDDVARGITEKMRRRNPHVFDPASIGRSPDDPPLDPMAIDELWERIKAEEGGG
jgi:XTP/dITP diphosphohydrolase